jgi:hypothetical protein
VTDFYALASRALQESFAVLGESFTWRGKSYGCALDRALHEITTLRDFFISNGTSNFPKRGDSIVVNGKKVQITKLENAAMKAVAGGTVEDQPFVDDPADPALEITFDKFVRR